MLNRLTLLFVVGCLPVLGAAAFLHETRCTPPETAEDTRLEPADPERIQDAEVEAPQRDVVPARGYPAPCVIDAAKATPKHGVEGTVRSAAGAALADVEISLVSMDDDGLTALASHLAPDVETDAGSFRISAVPPGTWCVQATARGHTRALSPSFVVTGAAETTRLTAITLTSAHPVRGLVTHRGRPVPGAILGFRAEEGGSRDETISDAQGGFELVHAALGRGLVVCSAPGLRGQALPVTRGQTDALRFELESTPVLRGRVLADGDGLADAELFAWRPGHARAVEAPRTKSDDHGGFEIRDLDGGIWMLQARGHRGFSEALRIDLDRSPLFLEVPIRPGHAIRGHLSDARGGAILTSARVAIESAEQGARLTAEADRSGAFVFTGLPAGAWHFSIEAPGYRELSGEVRLDGDETLQLRLEGRSSLRGRVLGIAKDWRPRTRVLAWHAARSAPYVAHVDASGEYSFDRLPDGAYRVRAACGDLRSFLLSAAGRDLQMSPIDVSLQRGPARLDLAAPTGLPASVAGVLHVTSEARLVVELAAMGGLGRGQSEYRERTNLAPDGGFRFADVPAGDYRLKLRGRDDQVVFTHDLRARGGEESRVELTLELGGISGTCELTEGVVHVAGTGPGLPQRTCTVRDGAFRVDALPVGRYRLTWCDQTGRNAELLVDVAPGGTTRVHLSSTARG